MGRILVTVLAGLALSTLGYYSLHSADLFSPTHQTAPATPATTVTLSNLPAPLQQQSAEIRVCLTSQPAASFDVKIDGPYSLQVMGSEKSLGEGKLLPQTRVDCEGQAIKIGKKEYHTNRLEIVPADSPAIWVDGHQYRGHLRLHGQPGGKLWAVNVLPLEDYIASVVDSEMPAAFPQAAREAQAICARTYAVYQMAQSRSHPYFDVYSSTRSQNYLGFQYLADGRRLAGETESGRRIAETTAGLVLVHNGQVFCTYYSAVCGGQTTRGDLVFTDAAPPLESVPCDDCRDARLYRWTEKHSKTAAAQKLGSLRGTTRQPLASIHRIDNGPLTPASQFQVSNGRKARLSAVELRRRFSLPSATFEVWQDAGHFHFQGRGHGHGVGLCQWGARGQALAGKTSAEILAHYYPSSNIASLPK